MAFATTTGSATIGATEFSIIAGSTTLPTETTDLVSGAMVGFQNLLAGDVYRVRVYESDGTTKRAAGEWFLAHAQSIPHHLIPPVLLMVGYDITVTKIAGTDRAITWAYSRVT